MHRDLPLLSTESVATAIGILSTITDAHSLTDTQRARLQRAYESIGKFLAEHPDFKGITIEVHPQGSMLLGTTTRPEGKIEIDIDLVVLLIPGYHAQIGCKELIKKLLDALNAYAEQHELGIEPKRRCVQLQYAGEMHADTTPVVFNPQPHRPYGDTYSLVPDRELSRYLCTNPKGFATWFGDAAKEMPTFALYRSLTELVAKADVKPLPTDKIFDRLLSRIVQLFKIHRNIYFAQHDFCPASAFLTTIIAKAYIAALPHQFQSPLDLILHIWKDMPNYVGVARLPDGREQWVVENPTADGDNLADRLNTPERQSAIVDWYQKFGEDFLDLISHIRNPQGIDGMSARIEKSFGGISARRFSSTMTEFAARERATERIHVSKISGVAAAAAPSITIASRPNRFFGSD